MKVDRILEIRIYLINHNNDFNPMTNRHMLHLPSCLNNLPILDE